MTRFALLLGSNDKYYVCSASQIEHQTGLTYKIKKKNVLVKLLCFNAKRQVLNELRDNLQTNRPSLEIAHSDTSAQDINKQNNSFVVDKTNDDINEHHANDENDSNMSQPCESLKNGSEHNISSSSASHAASEEDEPDPPQPPDSPKNDAELGKNNSKKTHPVESVKMKKIPQEMAGPSQFLERSMNAEEMENMSLSNSDNNSFFNDESNDFINEHHANDGNDSDMSQPSDSIKNGSEHNVGSSSDMHAASEEDIPDPPKSYDSPKKDSKFEQNVSNKAHAQRKKTQKPFPGTETSDSEYNPDSDFDEPNSDSNQSQIDDDELMDTADTNATVDTSSNRTAEQVDVSNDFEKSREAAIHEEFPFGVPGTAACNLYNLKTELSRGRKGDHKKNICLYCQVPQSKIARHLELVHANEEKVKEFSSLPPNNKTRKFSISLIRRKGNFINIDRKRNTNGLVIPVRRPRDPNKCSGDHYRPCPKCFGMFTKNNIRHHHCQGDKTTSKGIMTEAARVAGQVHQEASKKMRNHILPRLQEDLISNVVKFDKLIVLHGNDMSSRHRKQYLESMVRSELRLLARFLIVMKKLDKSIVDLTSVFDPKHWKKMLKALDIMGKLDPKKNIYKTPTVPFQLQIVLRKVADVLIRETIQDHDDVKKKNAEDMLKLMNQGFVNTVNKTVTESQVELRRQKSNKLPLTADIEKLSTYLESKMDKYGKLLERSFSLENWRALAEVTLTYILVYNRRRPGELERILKLDYKNLQGIDQEDEEYQQLSGQAKRSADEYVRFEIRGKLNRTVPVLLDQRMRKSIDLILKYSEAAGVSPRNPHVFGIPSADKLRFPFLRATILIRRFASECGAKKPDLLRATNLRKHMATQCANMNLESKETNKVAHFMGHNPSIHTNVYQQRKTTDIVVISNFLKTAQGRRSTLPVNTSLDYSTGLDTTAGTNNTVTMTDADTANESAANDSDNSGNVDDAPTVRDQTIAKKQTQKKKKDMDRPAINAPRKRRSNQKKRWSKIEIATVKKHFKKYLESGTLPSMSIIKQFQKTNNTLLERKPATIKVWLHNQMKKNRSGREPVGEETTSEESD